MISEVSKRSAATEGSSTISMFWGPVGRPVTAGQDFLAARPSVQLPRLAQPHSSLRSTSRTSLTLPFQNPERDAAATSLLEVLHTLLCSIRNDMNDFTKAMRAMDVPADSTIHFVGQNGPRYYPPGVATEDREFFVREREAEADKEVAQAATTLARQRHCAMADKQYYHFDRRKQSCKSNFRQGTRAIDQRQSKVAAAEAESCRIDRHRRKIEHLLHVLQDEIAKETRREIDFLEYKCLGRPGSRQSRRHMALIIKARYEAADRIMRILEEYKIVVGVQATDYLLRTIAEGKAVTSGFNA